jgi:hypothetical protein
MRYCTGTQMRGFGEAYEKIADLVGPANMVGEILTEAEAAALMRDV